MFAPFIPGTISTALSPTTYAIRWFSHCWVRTSASLWVATSPSQGRCALSGWIARGIDIFLTLHAISGGFRIAQAAIGSKVHRASVPKPGDMFEQIVYTLFSNLVESREFWLRKKMGDMATPEVFGLKEAGAPQEVNVDLKDLKAIQGT